MCVLSACRRERSGQTAVLLQLGTNGPVQCIVVTEAGESAAGATALEQKLELGAGLPEAFAKNERSAWKVATVSALIYSGNTLGTGKVELSAEGHRGSCTGPVVSKYGPVEAQFTQGTVVQQSGSLALIGKDADGDGYAAPEDCDDQDPTTYPGAPELCDGKDHSCSGVIDKGCPCTGGVRSCYPLGLASPTLGVGICKSGTQSCLGGKWGASCEGAVTPEQEKCDGLDHNCDGVVGLPSCPCTPGDKQRCYTKGPTAQAGVGRCKFGERVCGADGFYGACTGDVGPLPYEICNGIDDNCDGRIDEELDKDGKAIMVGRPPCSNQKGVCAGSRKSCVSGAFAACGPAEYQASALAHSTYYSTTEPATCDKIDHDCSGVIGAATCQSCANVGDQRDCYGPGLQSPNLQAGRPCRKGTQTCMQNRTGALLWSACAGEVLPQQEICDGQDNDCNGLVDDLVVGEGAACGTGQPGVCAAGYQNCSAARLTCAPLTPPSPEICDGLDNDCNGGIDEPWNKQTDPQHCGGTYDCRACDAGDACCGGRCASFQTDPLNCGSCGNACAANAACCSGKCVANDTSQNCGVCGKTCAADQTCQKGQCVQQACTPGGAVDCSQAACNHAVCDASGGHCFNGACAHETSCSDGIDNDGDGLTDCQDPQCLHRRCQQNGVCTAEKQCVVEICTNGIDDNGDGLVDCQDALACPAPATLATPACCGTAWTDAASDVLHCGSCANDCTVGHSAECGSVSCVAGKCSYGSAPDRTTCSAGVCCGGGCVPDRETSCTDGIDNNCDGLTDCQDVVSCPPPSGATAPKCCNLSWTDTDHGDPNNCGACGRKCAAPGGSCGVAVCNPGGLCGTATDCTLPGCDGVSCTTAGGGTGKCSGGACCAGCVTPDGVCHPGTDLHACVSASGACADCQTTNPCLSGSCSAAGCTRTPTSGNSCTDSSGATGFCNAGACCPANSCLDASGACQPIGVAHCGKPGGACLPASCDDGNPCTADSCDPTTPSCVHTPSSGASCTDGSATGKCTLGTCCLGCVSGNACVPQASQTATSCGTSGASCAACPATTVDCRVPVCTPSGTCSTAPAADGTACPGGGSCASGVCIVPNQCQQNLCGGVCCRAGDACTGGACACDAAACATAGGACSQQSPSHCVPASPQSCAGTSQKYCPANGGSCVASCGNFACGTATLTCGGPTCLASGAADTSNVCSDGVHPESCKIVPTSGFNFVQACSCDGTARPGTCPLGATAVCEPTPGSATFNCARCGDAGSDGLACKGGGICKATSGKCL